MQKFLAFILTTLFFFISHASGPLIVNKVTVYEETCDNGKPCRSICVSHTGHSMEACSSKSPLMEVQESLASIKSILDSNRKAHQGKLSFEFSSLSYSELFPPVFTINDFKMSLEKELASKQAPTPPPSSPPTSKPPINGTPPKAIDF